MNYTIHDQFKRPNICECILFCTFDAVYKMNQSRLIIYHISILTDCWLRANIVDTH